MLATNSAKVFQSKVSMHELHNSKTFLHKNLSCVLALSSRISPKPETVMGCLMTFEKFTCTWKPPNIIIFLNLAWCCHWSIFTLQYSCSWKVMNVYFWPSIGWIKSVFDEAVWSSCLLQSVIWLVHFLEICVGHCIWEQVLEILFCIQKFNIPNDIDKDFVLLIFSWIIGIFHRANFV